MLPSSPKTRKLSMPNLVTPINGRIVISPPDVLIITLGVVSMFQHISRLSQHTRIPGRSMTRKLLMQCRKFGTKYTSIATTRKIFPPMLPRTRQFLQWYVARLIRLIILTFRGGNSTSSRMASWFWLHSFNLLECLLFQQQRL